MIRSPRNIQSAPQQLEEEVTVSFPWNGPQQLPPLRLLHMEDCLRIAAQALQIHDIVEVHQLSFRDMISMQRLKLPCRSLFCTHLQCFDYLTLLETNKNKAFSDFLCPMCQQPANPLKIYLDMFWLKVIHYYQNQMHQQNSPRGSVMSEHFYLTNSGECSIVPPSIPKTKESATNNHPNKKSVISLPDRCSNKNIVISLLDSDDDSDNGEEESYNDYDVDAEDDSSVCFLDELPIQRNDEHDKNTCVSILFFKSYTLPAFARRFPLIKISFMSKWTIYDVLWMINHCKSSTMVGEMFQIDNPVVVEQLMSSRPFMCDDPKTLLIDLVLKVNAGKRVAKHILLQAINLVRDKIRRVFATIPNDYKTILRATLNESELAMNTKDDHHQTHLNNRVETIQNLNFSAQQDIIVIDSDSSDDDNDFSKDTHKGIYHSIDNNRSFNTNGNNTEFNSSQQNMLNKEDGTLDNKSHHSTGFDDNNQLCAVDQLSNNIQPIKRPRISSTDSVSLCNTLSRDIKTCDEANSHSSPSKDIHKRSQKFCVSGSIGEPLSTSSSELINADNGCGSSKEATAPPLLEQVDQTTKNIDSNTVVNCGDPRVNPKSLILPSQWLRSKQASALVSTNVPVKSQLPPVKLATQVPPSKETKSQRFVHTIKCPSQIDSERASVSELLTHNFSFS